MYNWNDGTYLAHHGILGQKWGVRRYQNPDGTLTEEGKKRQQALNYKAAKKTQKTYYRSNYNRMLDYQKSSKVVQERSKELTSLANKAKDLYFKLEDYSDREEVQNEANRRAWELAEKDPNYDHTESDEKLNEQIFYYYLYDKNILNKTSSELNKKDPNFQKIEKDYKDTIKAYKQTCNKIADDIIGSYGKEKISGLGTDMTYKELVYYALSKPNLMYMFTYEEDMGRK